LPGDVEVTCPGDGELRAVNRCRGRIVGERKRLNAFASASFIPATLLMQLGYHMGNRQELADWGPRRSGGVSRLAAEGRDRFGGKEGGNGRSWD
jgi:hypothetical protein